MKLFALSAFAILLLLPAAAADNVSDASFAHTIRPMLKEFCIKCHSTEKQKGDLDLERFSSLADIRKVPKVWQNVAEQLAISEMPPAKAPPLPAADKERLTQFVRTMLDEMAFARAGDPGPVVLRRLSNAEYTATIRDLTGVESLNPAREFPVDGAAGEGFTNTGQALVMSPTLISKYLDAAKDIAAHAVLLPDGIRFSSKTTRRDRTEEILAEIREFYREFTDPSAGGAKVNLQGVIFETNAGGRLPFEKYLAATLADREALAARKKTFDAAARERGLNAKYLETLFKTLSAPAGPERSLILDGLRTRWAGAKPNDAASLAAEIGEWQKTLWKFASVGHIGKLNGPKAWLEPVTPLTSKQEFKLKIPASKDKKDVTVYLVAGDAGDGNEKDFVVWQEPKLVAKGKPNVLLKDVKGVDATLFGHHPNGQPRDASSICVRAPSVLEFTLPADVAANCEFVTTGTLDKDAGLDGSVQLQVLDTKPKTDVSLHPTGATESQAKGAWTSNNQQIGHAAPIVLNDASPLRKQLESSFDNFRNLFPAALCYTKIVPVDEVVTLTLFYREDHQLARLMLDAAQKAKLDRMWDELRYVSQDALTLVDAFDQIYQFSTQDADPKVWEPLREPIKQSAAAFRKRLIDTEPIHLDAVIEFADRAWRRPISAGDSKVLRAFYQKLRTQEMPHDEAIRLTLARVLVAPAFLYRAETPGTGREASALGDFELAGRLSYFLWSSMPDAELRAVAATGTLHDPATLSAQTARMLQDPRVRRMATEFGCSWLHIHGFDELGEKSERHFPTFNALRGDMYEESIRFFTDLFQGNRSVLEILDADHAFLNDALAKHYGIPGINGAEWRRVEGVKKFSRGGILGQATTLAKQSGASRTSPILRGNWVAEALLGDKLPRPPKDVPQLPEDEATEKLTMRELTEKHTSDARCSGCHQRIDAFGFSLEGFDAIGRRRDKDLGNRPIDTRAKTMDGAEFKEIDGLRNYLLSTRRDAFLRQFCRKLLGYSLGRAVQLSDEPLLKDLQAKLKTSEFRVGVAIDMIVRSPQFRNIRGKDAANDD